ncbi:MAG: tetratricopeptide repeat protein, partial [Deltaproteobacteria bacterium]|nr:tetratricopeptide repeat protein [Deltaproteobacteria bacterium]
DRAGGAAAQLPSLSDCKNHEALLSPLQLPQDPAARAARDALEAARAEAAADVRTGRYAHGESTLNQALSTPEAPGLESALARLHTQRAQLHRIHARYVESARDDVEAARLALAARDEAALADAWISQLQTTGGFQNHFDEARTWAVLSAPIIARLRDPEREGLRLVHLATVEQHEDHTDEALRDMLRARELLAQSGPDSFNALRADEALAAFNNGRCEYEAARDAHARILERDERVFGKHHPRTLLSAVNLADDQTHLGQLGPAEALLRDSLAAGTFVDRDAAWAHNRLAVVLRSHHDLKAALAEDEESVRLYTSLGPDGLEDLSWSLADRGETLLALGRAAEAAADFKRSLDLRKDSSSDMRAEAMFGHARATATKDRAAARDEATAALAIYDGLPKEPCAKIEGDKIRAWLAR